MSNYRCFQIELTRGYDYSAFREDLKKLYHYAGVKGENTVFLFSDTQVNISSAKKLWLKNCKLLKKDPAS